MEQFNFSEQQELAFNSYKGGENIFITGPGGCGKSYFIKKVYEDALQNHKKVSVTSMTGCSAILLGCNATTIHRWGTLGLGNSDPVQLTRKIMKMKRTGNYIETDLLIIDEVSMLNEKLFETLDTLCKRLRKEPNIPFGGMQLIFSGDFYQLPPVCKDKTNTKESNFCFQSALWDETFHNIYLFNESFRQQEDTEFCKMLMEIRKGQVSFDTVEKLVECSKKRINDDDPVKPTKIFPIKKTVDNINKTELSKLTEKMYKYNVSVYHNEKKIMDIGLIQEKELKNMIDYTCQNSIFEQELELCIGCQVMCISNINQEIGLVNGSQGVVNKFVYSSENQQYYPVVKFDNIDEPITITENGWTLENNEHYQLKQLPLILSWAITTHKSQGLTIQKALIDIGSNVFEYGQTYVALSRMTSMDGLYLSRINAKKIKAHPEVMKFYNNLESR